MLNCGCLLPAIELVREQDWRAHSLVAVPDLESIHLTFDLSLTAGKQQRIFHRFPIQTQALDETLEFRDLRALGFARPGLQSGFVAVGEDLTKSAHRLIRSGNEFTLLQQALYEALFWSLSLLFEEEPQRLLGGIRRILLHLFRASQRVRSDER